MRLMSKIDWWLVWEPANTYRECYKGVFLSGYKSSNTRDNIQFDVKAI